MLGNTLQASDDHVCGCHVDCLSISADIATALHVQAPDAVGYALAAMDATGAAVVQGHCAIRNVNDDVLSGNVSWPVCHGAHGSMATLSSSETVGMYRAAGGHALPCATPPSRRSWLTARCALRITPGKAARPGSPEPCQSSTTTLASFVQGCLGSSLRKRIRLGLRGGRGSSIWAALAAPMRSGTPPRSR